MVRAISKEKKDGGRIIKRRMDEREKEKRKEREEMVKVEASGKNLLVRKLPLARMAKETLRSPFEILLGFASPLPANDLKLLIAVTA